MTEHYNVAIATPGRQFHGEYVMSLVRTLSELSRLGITYTFLNRYSSFIPTARELTAIDSPLHDYETTKIASGKFTCDKIFWIDSDIEWEPQDFLKLYRTDLEAVSGLYALDQTGLVAANKLDPAGVPKRTSYKDFMFEEEPVLVGGVGFGFLCVKADAFERVPRPWFLIGRLKWMEDSEMRVNVGEDYSWCGRAQQSGISIYVDPTVRVKHHKEAVLTV